MKQIITLCISIFLAIQINAQKKLNFFLPDNVSYDKSVPTPEQFFGQKLGEWHLNHDQVLAYMREISRVSDRAIFQEYARSWENRPLVHVLFTSSENHSNLAELKELHTKHADPNESVNGENVPLVVALTYGVHGNESSASNSSVLSAYYLAAAQGDKIDELLKNTIIIVDPCLNPDGFVRHSTWANMHQSYTLSAKGDSRQFNEVWPGGRTNHYWFDLNRDYLLLVNPESKGRVAKFHEWLPNIVTDHHEMGSGSTFFFQPGVPSRNNPLTPENNYILTREIAKYHARFLDEIGTPYFTEERFDDYYFGKGSSYPDINSSVGILFEQAGFRGRYRETSNGLKSLAFGIKNQFTVTLSTLEAAGELKEELLQHQKGFYKEALELAEKDNTKAYIISNQNDKVKTEDFIDLLNQHQIEVYYNDQEVNIGNNTYSPENSFIIPVKQKQYRLLKSIFQDVTTFADSTFYDVSTWTIPYSYNIQFEAAKSLKDLRFSKRKTAEAVKGKIIGGKSSLAYLFRWNEFTSTKALYQLQQRGLITKVATNQLSFNIDSQKEDFTYGTILVPVSGQRISQDRLYDLVKSISKNTGVDFYGLTTGLSPEGIDIGSNSFASLKRPEILLFVGGSVSSRDAGEIWHMFDQRYNIPVTLVETSEINSIDLSRYNNIIMPGGSYREFSKSAIQKLRTWTSSGGNLIAYKSATAWAARNDLSKVEFKPSVKPDSTLKLSYANRYKEASLNYISGAIFNTEMDISHPLCYGYINNQLPVFKTGTSVAISLDKKYTEPVQYTSNPYLSGFVSDNNLDRINNAPVVSVQKLGSGKIISYYDNMMFRGIWLGTNKLFSNSVFFGSIIR